MGTTATGQQWGLRIRVDTKALQGLTEGATKIANLVSQLNLLKESAHGAMGQIAAEVNKVNAQSESSVARLRKEIETLKVQLNGLKSQTPSAAAATPRGATRPAYGDGGYMGGVAIPSRGSAATNKFLQQHYGVSETYVETHRQAHGGARNTISGSMPTPTRGPGGQGHYDNGQVMAILLYDKVTRPIVASLQEMRNQMTQHKATTGSDSQLDRAAFDALGSGMNTLNETILGLTKVVASETASRLSAGLKSGEGAEPPPGNSVGRPATGHTNKTRQAARAAGENPAAEMPSFRNPQVAQAVALAQAQLAKVQAAIQERFEKLNAGNAVIHGGAEPYNANRNAPYASQAELRNMAGGLVAAELTRVNLLGKTKSGNNAQSIRTGLAQLPMEDRSDVGQAILAMSGQPLTQASLRQVIKHLGRNRNEMLKSGYVDLGTARQPAPQPDQILQPSAPSGVQKPVRNAASRDIYTPEEHFAMRAALPKSVVGAILTSAGDDASTGDIRKYIAQAFRLSNPKHALSQRFATSGVEALLPGGPSAGGTGSGAFGDIGSRFTRAIPRVLAYGGASTLAYGGMSMMTGAVKNMAEFEHEMLAIQKVVTAV